MQRAGDFQASSFSSIALSSFESSQAKSRLDFEVQASSLIQAFATKVFRWTYKARVTGRVGILLKTVLGAELEYGIGFAPK